MKSTRQNGAFTMAVIARLLGFGFVLFVACTTTVAATTYAYRPKSGICGAAVNGDVKGVKACLSANPKAVNERDREATPLHCAADGRQKATVEYLLKQGAQVNAVDESGRTPLRWAQDESVKAGFWDRRKLGTIADLLRQNGGAALSSYPQNIQTNKSSTLRSE